MIFASRALQMMWFIFMSSAIILFYGGARVAAVHKLANHFAFNPCLVFKASISPVLYYCSSTNQIRQAKAVNVDSILFDSGNTAEAGRQVE